MDDRTRMAPAKHPVGRQPGHPAGHRDEGSEKHHQSPGIYNPLTETADFRREMNDGNPHKEPRAVTPPPHKGHGGKYEPRAR
jgi:hypothetical protein